MAATKINFTKAALARISTPPPGKRTEIYDHKTRGLMVRVTHRGNKSFVVYRRVNGRPQRVKLGSYPDMIIEQARKAAGKTLSKMADGVDPIAEKRAGACRQVSLQAVLDAYIASHDLKPGTVKDYRQAVKESFADWLNKPLSSITKDMVERRHRERGLKSKARANNAMRVLRALFNYAAAKYEDADGNPFIDVNPVTRLSALSAWHKVPRRQTVIKNHQLPAWFWVTGLTVLINIAHASTRPIVPTYRAVVNRSTVTLRSLLYNKLNHKLRYSEAMPWEKGQSGNPGGRSQGFQAQANRRLSPGFSP